MASEGLGKVPARALLEAAAGLAAVLLLLHTAANTRADADLWGYLAFGRIFWDTGVFPYRDLFSYTPTLPVWVYHEWLTGVLLYPLYQKFGGAGLQLLRYGLALCILALVYLTARRRGADRLSCLLMLVVVKLFLVIGFSPIRAQVFTYAAFAATLYLLERARLTGRWRALWLLVPLQVLWCNLHGGFLAGLGLIALYALGEAVSRRPFRPYLQTLALATLATLINPYGLKYWIYLVHAISMPRPLITEWTSMWGSYRGNLINTYEVLYNLAVIALAVLLAVRARWREITPILALAVALYLGLRHYRHMVFFLLLAGAYLPPLLQSRLEPLRQRLAALPPRGLRAAALALFPLALVLGYQFVQQRPLNLDLPPLPQERSLPGNYYPVGALAYLRTHRLGGSLLTEFGWGEYLFWNLYPQCRVALDGRYETVYPDAVCQSYFAFFLHPDQSPQFLAQYPPELILVDSRSRVFAFLSGRPEWLRLYEDGGAALFRRRK